MKTVISSGHGKYVRGAVGYIDEVDEARNVVNKIAEFHKPAIVFHDDVSRTQSENLDRIVDFHNAQERDLDVSVHFNAYNITDKPMGCECLYLTQSELAATVCKKVSAVSELKNRGAKKRDDLFFLNKTDMPSILIEVCFVDSKADVELYDTHFAAICGAISDAIAGLRPIEIPTGLNKLLCIGNVTIYEKDDGQYVRFISDLDICNDGTGPSHGDPSYQSETAYYNNGEFLNADKDKYIVIPPQIRSMVPPVVMGCKARMTNLKSGVWNDAVTGEIGPKDKTGEAAYCLAKVINPSITHNAGDKDLHYLYELWPGIPAVVNGKTYALQPTG
jgi:N-acetylmuramoyl-L-alanine amidase